jgi:hypothetical protein
VSAVSPVPEKEKDRSAHRKTIAASSNNGGINTPELLEQCDNMWQFIFGESMADHGHNMLTITCGSQEELFTLLKVWKQMDKMGDGRADFQDFQHYVDSLIVASQGLHTTDPLHGMTAKDFQALASKVAAQMLAKKSSFQIEDIMKFLWPAASLLDLKDIHRWTDDVSAFLVNLRVKTPPVLPKSELAELTAVFDFFDADASGTISFEEMIGSGLLDKETATRYMKEFDSDGSRLLSSAEFYEMMCPSRYRAFDGAVRASDENGLRVVYEPVMGGWRQAGSSGETIFDLMPRVGREKKHLVDHSVAQHIASGIDELQNSVISPSLE